MDVVQLTRALVDIESITGNEKTHALRVMSLIEPLVKQYGGRMEQMDVESDRFNVFVCWGEPVVTMSTHLDTVPPFFASREDNDYVWGRGACDVKGIIASMLCAAEKLLADSVRNFGLLFVVGEERNSAGAFHAARNTRGSRFLINGEPTENQLALGSKGALRYEVESSGRMAHSAYPELGESAINKLLDALERVRGIKMPVDELLGPGNLNIGTISGGRAPNVIADSAKAEVMIRLVDDPAPIRKAFEDAVRGLAATQEILCVPAVRLGAIEGFRTTVVSYTTDIPAFNGSWGKPYLIGPGTIHVAHTSEERVPKKELFEAVEIYQRMVRQLLS